MFTVALALLLAPDLPDLPGQLPPDVYQAMKDQAELLDLYKRSGNWQADSAKELCWARAALRSTRGAPPSADVCWLPSGSFIEGALSFNRQMLTSIDARQPTDDLLLMRDEVLRLRNVWHTAGKARDNETDLSARRKALASLRETIGDEAYRIGQMPPWVPVWRMNVVE